MKQLKKINDKIENNDKLKYDYIIYEHCPINSFNIEYIKYYNILKLNGYLIIYIDQMFNSKLELVNNKKPNKLNYVQNLDNQNDYEEDLQKYQDFIEEPKTLNHKSLYEFGNRSRKLYLNSLNKIFVKVNKYIYKKQLKKYLIWKIYVITIIYI